jgi:hypothetical protein
MSEEIQKRTTFVRMPDGSIRAVSQSSPVVASTSPQNPTPPPLSPQPNVQTTAAFEQRMQPPPSLAQPRFSSAGVSTTPLAAQKPIPEVKRGPILGSLRPAPNQGPQKADAVTKEIAISLALPKVSLLRPFRRLRSALKQLFRWQIAVISAVIVIAIVGWLVGVPSLRSPVTGKSAATISQAVVKPTFKTLAPNGALTTTVSKAITYDQSKKVASFEDTINGVQITVSMQPLPDSVKPDVSANVQKIAEGFAANTKLNVSSGDAYLGTSEKGPQSIVGDKNNLLVFMYSSTKIDQQAWANYFNALK